MPFYSPQTEQRFNELRQQVQYEQKKQGKFIQLLHLAARFASEAPDTQVQTDEGEVVDGRWLAAHIEDVLGEKK